MTKCFTSVCLTTCISVGDVRHLLLQCSDFRPVLPGMDAGSHPEDGADHAVQFGDFRCGVPARRRQCVRGLG